MKANRFSLLPTPHSLLPKVYGRLEPSVNRCEKARSPWYRFDAGLELPAGAFHPEPGVCACLLAATKRNPPLVAPEHRELFRAFVRGAFDERGNAVGKVLRPWFTGRQIRRVARDNGFSTDAFPSELTVRQWAGLFEFMVRVRCRGIVGLSPGSVRKTLPEQAVEVGFHDGQRLLTSVPTAGVAKMWPSE